MGTGIRWVCVWVNFYTHGYEYGKKFVHIDYTDMGMILIYPTHNLPIAITKDHQDLQTNPHILYKGIPVRNGLCFK
jgi:hypothetical protein